MKRLLHHMSKRDWMLVIGGLAVVLGLQMAKRNDPSLPSEAQAGLPAPVPVPDPTGLPPSPDGLADDAYHLRTAPAEQMAEVVQPDPGHAVVFFGATNRIAVHHALPSGDVQAAFDQLMRDAPYFGAFAVAENGAYGWTTGYATQAAAKASALAHCAEHAQDCRIAAELLPEDLTGEGPANSVSYEQAQAYASIRAGSGPRALALSVDGTWSYSGAASQPEAISMVLRNCETARAGQPDFLPRMPCKVVALWD